MSEKAWTEIPIAGIIEEAGNAQTYETGSWRTYRPVWDSEKCIHCLSCWIACPDSSILVKDGKMTGIDLTHCKGCGICAFECPDKITAIEMKLETDIADD